MPFDFSTTQKPLKVFSLAGLTDIVLLLLIFFLLTSNFVPQFGIEVTLPETETSAPAEEQHISVVITDDGRFYVGQEEVTRQALLPTLRRERGDRALVILRADQSARIGEFAAVASAARALDMRVLMATERSDVTPR